MANATEHGIQAIITIEGISCKSNDQACIKHQVKKLQERYKKRGKEIKTGSHFQEASIIMDQWVQKNFKTEGALVGGWKELAAGGRYVRGGFDTSAKILQDTGRLRSSFLPFYSPMNAGIGSDIPYAEKHEEGKDGLPKRRMLPERKDVWPKIKEMFNRKIMEILKK